MDREEVLLDKYLSINLEQSLREVRQEEGVEEGEEAVEVEQDEGKILSKVDSSLEGRSRSSFPLHCTINLRITLPLETFFVERESSFVIEKRER